MTTIAANLNRMAADSRVVAAPGSFNSDKLLRTKRGIVGAAGDGAYCVAVIEWFDGKRAKPRIPKAAEFAALLLNEKGLFYIEYDLALNRVHEGIYAIGSGAEYALGAMERDLLLGNDPDPVTAVMCACRRDCNSAEPVSFLSLGKV